MEEKWTIRFHKIAKDVSTWSKDPSTKVGAVIVSEDKRRVSWGYNGFPQQIADTEKRLNNRELKYKLTLHAEANAIHNATFNLKGSTLFLYGMPGPPCLGCAKAIMRENIKEIYTISGETPQRWQEDYDFSETMLDEAGIICHYVSIDKLK